MLNSDSGVQILSTLRSFMVREQKQYHVARPNESGQFELNSLGYYHITSVKRIPWKAALKRHTLRFSILKCKMAFTNSVTTGSGFINSSSFCQVFLKSLFK